MLLHPKSQLHERAKEVAFVVEQVTTGDPRLAIGLFGSRAIGKPHPHSDWDLGVTWGREALPTARYLRLVQQARDAAEDLPHRVDLIHLDAAPSCFISSIDYTPLFLAGSYASWLHFLGRIDGTRQAS